MGIYIVHNGAMPTTGMQTPQLTGTAVRTMLQLATPSTADIEILEWGVSFAGAAAGVGVRCELVDTGTVPATGLTAHTATGLVKWDPAMVASALTLGTGATGYSTTAPTEGTITATRVLGSHYVQPTGERDLFWPLAEYPKVAASSFLRVRMLATVDVLALCSVRIRE